MKQVSFVSMEYYWWEKSIILPIRRIYRGVASRLGYRKQKTILMLSREVQACEYEDVQIMWDMLKRTETPEVNRSRTLIKNKTFRNVFAWARGTCLSNKF